MSCALSIRFTPAAAATVRVLMYRPRKALKITSAQQSAPAPTFFKLVLFRRYHKHAVPSHPFCSEKNIWGGQAEYVWHHPKEPPPE